MNITTRNQLIRNYKQANDENVFCQIFSPKLVYYEFLWTYYNN